MNDSLLRKFCESQHRKLIVIIVTGLLGLVVMIPLVDEYFDNKSSHATLSEELDRARQIEAGLGTVEREVAEIVQNLDKIESRAISNDSVSDYRSKIVELVRDAGCQVRRFDVGSPSRRAWLKNDNPLTKAPPKGAKQQKTPFALQQRNVVLLVDGQMENVHDFLAKLHQDESFAHLQRLELRAAPGRGDQVTVELEMWLFALDRQPV